MRTLLFALTGAFSLFAPLTFAHADTTPATIIIGGRVVPFQVKPFIGANGQVLAPVDAVQLLGAKYAPGPDNTVIVTAANGKRYSFADTIVSERYCVDFKRVAETLGGSVNWQPSTETLTVRAKLEMVRQDAGTLTIYTSYPIYYSVKRINNPERLYVDLSGLDLATTPANIPSESGNVTHIRSGQMDAQTVRITIDLKEGQPFRVLSGIETNQVQVALGETGSPVPIVPVLPTVAAAVPPSAGAVTITNVDFKIISPALTQISVTTSGPTHCLPEALDNPSRLAFDFAGAALDKSVKLTQSVNNPIVKAIRIGKFFTEKTAFGRVVLDLAKMVSYSVDSRPTGSGMTYLINVITDSPQPPVLDPGFPKGPLIVENPFTLTGKIVVIDPGHGGRDTGARDEFRTGQFYEKDITLAIGRRLREVLQKAGATVLMTRDDDTLPSVMARPAFANDHHADYFVSIHCDSSGGQNSHAGTTVYFHAQNGLCRRMAADIGRQVSEKSGITYNGVKSDTIRFSTGFGVLRGSAMPAVLIETGYMNNDDDLAKLRNDETQQNIAQGIVFGLQDFLKDQAGQIRSARGGHDVTRSAY